MKDKNVSSEGESALLQKISKREREVLKLVGLGTTSKEIAQQLGVCQRTIEVHRTNLMKKLGVNNAVGLGQWEVLARQKNPE